MWLVLVACAGSKLPVETLTVDGHAVQAEIATTYSSRQQGLMHRDRLDPDSGMLFVYKDEAVRRFWMKDTRIPLSIAFANRHGEILRIQDMTPFDTDSITSLIPATYALEMSQGWFAEKGIGKGAKIGGIPTELVVE
jgi:uncharacterized membrane protein (UPF0127 family)